MAVITNDVTHVTINTSKELLAVNNKYGIVVVHNNHATADVYVNIDAAAASTGTIAGVVIAPKGSVALPVYGRAVNTASGTTVVPVAYYEQK
jgi:hypothetical protein